MNDVGSHDEGVGRPPKRKLDVAQAMLGAIIGTIITAVFTVWIPWSYHWFKGEIVYTVNVRTQKKPVSGVHFKLSDRSNPNKEVASGDTNDYGSVSLSTGTGTFNVNAYLCKAEKEQRYFGSFQITSLPSEKDLDLDNDFVPASFGDCPSTEANSTIARLSAASGKTYGVGRLRETAIAYIDRSNYIFTNVPAFLSGATYIVTANDDKCPANASSFSLAFDLAVPSTIYVAHDDRYLNKPAWLSGFRRTNDSLTIVSPGNSGSYKYKLYRQDFSAGPVLLGGNIKSTCQTEGNFGMYSVVIAPLATIPQAIR